LFHINHLHFNKDIYKSQTKLHSKWISSIAITKNSCNKEYGGVVAISFSISIGIPKVYCCCFAAPLLQHRDTSAGDAQPPEKPADASLGEEEAQNLIQRPFLHCSAAGDHSIHPLHSWIIPEEKLFILSDLSAHRDR
jgi:hypothetical protein